MSVVEPASDASVMPAGRWLVDAPRSNVAFSVRHMMLARMNGRFREFDGTLQTGAQSRATGVVKAASINTGEPTRDEHLRHSQDFFDIERYPEINFSSTQIDHLDGGGLQIVGELTMRGVTREIALRGTRREAADDERIELALGGELDRRDFGLAWNQVLDSGGALLGNKVTITLEISAVKDKNTTFEIGEPGVEASL
jgi:polyisoprenoid-binding protein YceI